MYLVMDRLTCLMRDIRSMRYRMRIRLDEMDSVRLSIRLRLMPRTSSERVHLATLTRSPERICSAA